MSTQFATVTLIVGMLATGCSNSLWSKFQDKQCVENCQNPDPSTHQHFEQPVWQTLNMFAGESLCLIAFYLIKYTFKASKPISLHDYQPIPRHSEESQPRGSEDHPIISDSLIQPIHLNSDDPSNNDQTPLAVHGPTPNPIVTSLEPNQLTVMSSQPETFQLIGIQKMIFWLPTIFDICGTTLMNVGLLFVPVSVFQMIRGALPLWVAFFSVIFLKRTFKAHKWLSLLIITFGVALVGFAGSLQSKEKTEMKSLGADDGTKTVLGIFLIFFAQVFSASQFVVEEKIMTKYEVPPLEAVGLEGIFGLFTTVIAIPVLHIFIGSKPAGRKGYFDANEGFHQIISNSQILWSSLAIAISISMFNFCGLAVTKHISATVRSVIDTCRSIGIWMVSIGLGWEVFNGLQLLGFLILILGTFLFNEIWVYPIWFLNFLETVFGFELDAPQHHQRDQRLD
ncbi:uncharacterized protein MELLADRAFT_48630 [Melampsora larici-populina 98AG31]|uniref:Integral membrane protein n=1 Tax=Melampsora larici-populina (strain 98AG31 / pathotype 3-4-7) TaxID=747676 RepID=F4RP83_MELLP|nr:uncharacterized protein MELLADRAFT_48630 [Melampsora larici-populina 98AG31]EGG05896.1 hypothetical protein MELLADRAFT_48630 [Melampsora larici-populina 98AG31]